MPRSRKDHLRLKNKPKTGKCPFCDPVKDEVITEYDNFFVLANAFPYANWDMSPVQEHLLLTPKTHVTKLGELDTAQISEYMQILVEYQDRGYSTYTRSSGSHMKSQLHLHTHLIKLVAKQNRLEFTSTSPYINIHI